MHGTACARAHGRAHARSGARTTRSAGGAATWATRATKPTLTARAGRPRTFKDRPARRIGRSGSRDVGGAWSGLRHHHAAHGSSRRCWRGRSGDRLDGRGRRDCGEGSTDRLRRLRRCRRGSRTRCARGGNGTRRRRVRGGTGNHRTLYRPARNGRGRHDHRRRRPGLRHHHAPRRLDGRRRWRRRGARWWRRDRRPDRGCVDQRCVERGRVDRGRRTYHRLIHCDHGPWRCARRRGHGVPRQGRRRRRHHTRCRRGRSCRSKRRRRQGRSMPQRGIGCGPRRCLRHGYRRTRSRRRRRTRRGLRLLALQNGLQRIAGFGNMGKVELLPRLSLWLPCTGGRTAAAMNIAAHLFRLILFNGARMRLFFGDAHRSQSIQNAFAFDL